MDHSAVGAVLAALERSNAEAPKRAQRSDYADETIDEIAADALRRRFGFSEDP